MLPLVSRNSSTQRLAFRQHTFRTFWQYWQPLPVWGIAWSWACRPHGAASQSKILVWSRRSCVQSLFVGCRALPFDLQASVVQNLLSALLPASCLLPKLRQVHLPVPAWGCPREQVSLGAVLAGAGSCSNIIAVLHLAPSENRMLSPRLSPSSFMSVPLWDLLSSRKQQMR